MTDKKKGIPIPEVEKLTKTQKKLFEKNKAEIEGMTREIFGYIAERINRLGVQVMEGLLENFLIELGLSDDDWEFQPEKNQFRKKDK